MTYYPTTIELLSEELAMHAKDGRGDAGFRLAIALAQVGDLANYFTHDPTENPVARPYGTPDGERAALGHAIVQIITYCILRKINPQDAINVALDNLRSKDFIKREKQNLVDCSIRGVPACTGWAKGPAVVNPKQCSYPVESILIIEHPSADFHPGKCSGIVTNQGGYGCHAAIVAREFGIPCIVGTGNATDLIKDGDTVEIIVNKNTGTVKITGEE